MIVSSSATSTVGRRSGLMSRRSVTAGPRSAEWVLRRLPNLVEHPFQERVLFGAKLRDARESVVAGTHEASKVVGGFAGFPVGQRRLGNERTDARLLGHVLLEHDLLFEDARLRPLLRDLVGESRQPFADVQGEVTSFRCEGVLTLAPPSRVRKHPPPGPQGMRGATANKTFQCANIV